MQINIIVLINEISIYHGDVMVGYYNPDSPLFRYDD